MAHRSVRAFAGSLVIILSGMWSSGPAAADIGVSAFSDVDPGVGALFADRSGSFEFSAPGVSPGLPWPGMRPSIEQLPLIAPNSDPGLDVFLHQLKKPPVGTAPGPVDRSLESRYDLWHPFYSAFLGNPQRRAADFAGKLGMGRFVLSKPDQDFDFRDGNLLGPSQYDFLLDDEKWKAPQSPVPGALLLSTLGMGLVGWARRRRSV